MKALVFGAGKIARGFVAQLLRMNEVDVVFVEKVPQLVEQLNEAGSYEVHILGNEALNTRVDGYRAICLDDVDAIAAEMRDADIAFTSVIGKNLKDVGGVIGRAYVASGMDRTDAAKLNFVTCENWKHPIQDLHEGIWGAVPQELHAQLERDVAVTEAVIMRIAVEPTPENKAAHPLDVWVQDFWDLPVDGSHYEGTFPTWEHIHAIEGFGTLLEQKMFTNNTSNAGIAYLGYLLGYEKVADAARCPEVSAFLDELYPEINRILIAGLGVDPAGQEEFSRKAREKYSNPLIVDYVSRQAKDPIRKLGPEDRLVAPARLGLAQGIEPTCISRVLAAAVYYDMPGDEAAEQLAALRAEKGFEGVLREVCQLSEDEPLWGLALAGREWLMQKGWLKDA